MKKCASLCKKIPEKPWSGDVFFDKGGAKKCPHLPRSSSASCLGQERWIHPGGKSERLNPVVYVDDTWTLRCDKTIAIAGSAFGCGLYPLHNQPVFDTFLILSSFHTSGIWGACSTSWRCWWVQLWWGRSKNAKQAVQQCVKRETEHKLEEKPRIAEEDPH